MPFCSFFYYYHYICITVFVFHLLGIYRETFNQSLSMFNQICFYVCKCVCLYVCMYVGRYICVYLYMYVSRYICIYIYIYLYMFVCIYLCIQVFIYVCMRLSAFYTAHIAFFLFGPGKSMVRPLL